MSMRFHHVANGSATTDLIERAGIPGSMSLWADVLTDGPVPDVPDERLIEIRAEFLASDREPFERVKSGLTDWRRMILDAPADEVVLWYEHDLFDQLNLVQLLDFLGGHQSTLPSVSLICINAFPGRSHFMGLGQLTPAELSTLLETRRPIDRRHYDLGSAAWRAFRSTDPRQIETVCATDSPVLPFLSPALRRYLEDFPWTTDGLSKTERRALALASDGPVEVASGFTRMHEFETAFYVTDGSYWELLEQLASSEPALVSLEITSRSAGTGWRLPQGTFELSAFGAAVIGRRQDRISACGLDRWRGGVHLQTPGAIWRWDPGAHQIRAD